MDEIIELGNISALHTGALYYIRLKAYKLTLALTGEKHLATLFSGEMSDLFRWFSLNVKTPVITAYIQQGFSLSELVFLLTSKDDLQLPALPQSLINLRYLKKNASLDWQVTKISIGINAPLFNKTDIEDLIKIVQIQSTDEYLENLATSNQELKEMKLRSEKALQVKTEFLANISHEIRTPMNAIIGMTHLTLNTELSNQQKDFLEKILSSGNHLLSIINNILDYSKIESGKMELEAIEFRLDDLLETINNLYSFSAAVKNIDIIYDIEPDVPFRLIGDSLRLSQILINFITNALKFTEHGQITIRIKNLQHSVDKVLLNFSVSDTGIGLTPEQINRLFQNFQQIDSSTTRKYGGTGLGLSISKEFIELMGGTVGVTSEINEGSTFWFTLWFATPNLDDSNRVLCKQHPKPILIISNNSLYCTAFKKLALSQHLTTDVAETALLGLDLIQQVDSLGQSYQLIFISSKIYEQENLTLFKKIKLLPITSQPKIILINQSGFNDYFVKTNDLFDGVLLKPTTPIGLSKQLSLLADNDIQQLDNQPLDAFNKSLKQIAGATALIVDDNELNREVISLLLQEVGINCDFAENGLIAVNKITINRYDIVLMDVQMPIMDGLQATSQIRKLDDFKQLPIVALTANTAPECIANCLTIGMNDYLSKPIDPDVLWSTLIKWIKPREIIGETVLQDRPISIKIDPLMPNINGLDITDGLKRVLNNQTVYLSLLRKFIDNQRAFPNSIRSALENHQWHQAELLAHTLKGVAGNIGANKLSAKADILEKLIHNQDTSDLIDIACNQTNLLLNQLIEDIENQVLIDMEEDISIDNPYQNIEDLLEQIKQLLIDSDGDAVDLFNKNQAKIKARFPSYFLRLQDCASNYDFEEMILCLDEASKITNQNID